MISISQSDVSVNVRVTNQSTDKPQRGGLVHLILCMQLEDNILQHSPRKGFKDMKPNSEVIEL